MLLEIWDRSALEDEEQTFQYRVSFEWLAENSLTRDQTSDLIADTVRGTWI
jgi:hypothetical protein